MRTEGSDPDGGDVPYPDLPSSLASTAVGEEVVVDRILPGRAQARCREHGLQVGDRVQVEGRRGGQIVVSIGDGSLVHLLKPDAFFVRVRGRAPAPPE